MYWLASAEMIIWFGCAAFGFAVLFNVPPRTLLLIAVLGVVSGGVKLLAIALGSGVIMASFFGATMSGLLSVWAAHTKHSPPVVFAIPAVIPLVPGVFAYRMMLGIINLAGSPEADVYPMLLSQTVNNGIKTTFILFAIALGVSLPMLLLRKESIKELRAKA